VTFTANHQAGTTDTITVTNNGEGYFNAWIDFNADGDWADVGEQIFADHFLLQGTHILTLTISDTAKTDTTFMRCRYTTNLGIGYDGLVYDGEVEDYMYIINENMSLVDTIINGQDTCYYALNTITAPKSGGKYVIESGGNVTFVARQKIYLKPGFHAKTGSYFHAYIGDGCPVTTTAPVITNLLTHGDGNIDDLVQIYPNPTTGMVYLRIESDSPDELIHIQVFSIVGKRIINKTIPFNADFHLDLSQHNKGVYIIKLLNNNEIHIVKLIKQ